MKDFPPKQAETMLRYVLDELPEAERVAVDEAMVSDEAFGEEWEATARDLTDAYVAGEMDAALRSRMERALEASAKLREMLRYSKAMAERSKAAVQVAAEQEKPLVSRWHLIWMVPLAASVMVAMFLSFKKMGAFGTENDVPKAVQSSPAVAPVTNTGAADKDVASAGKPADDHASARTRANEGVATVATLHLLDAIRGAEAMKLPVRAGAEQLKVEWSGAAQEQSATLTVARADGSVVARDLPGSHGRWSVDAKALDAGRYFFRVSVDGNEVYEAAVDVVR